MTTNLVIIDDALGDIGVIADDESASAEQGKFCLRRLNQMMEAHKEDDISLGWFAQTATTAQIPIPDWAELGVVGMLALAIAPRYGATASAEAIRNADEYGGKILRKSLSESLTGLDMSHLPRGAGNRYGRHNILTDS